MSGFSAIELAKLPAPDVVETLDFEAILQELKADLLTRDASLEKVLNLESEPIVKLLEVTAYREMVLRQRVNDAARSVMLAYARGRDLENLAALFAVKRQMVDPGNPDAHPPISATMENDARLRTRTQLSPEGMSTAGPVGAYVYWALAADPKVKDVSVVSPQPGEVLVTVLSNQGKGDAGAELLDQVRYRLNQEDVRPLTDKVMVQGATLIDYQVEAVLHIYHGPDADVVRQAAQDKVSTFTQEQHRLGRDITLSGLYAALHQPGVQRVEMVSPIADIEVKENEAAYCSSISLTIGDIDNG